MSEIWVETLRKHLSKHTQFIVTVSKALYFGNYIVQIHIPHPLKYGILSQIHNTVVEMP